MHNKDWLTVLAVFLIITGVILFLYLICRCRKINRANGIIKIASRMSIRNSLLLILSVVIVITQVCVFFYEIYIMLRIYTSGEERHDKEDGNPFVFYDLNDWNKFLIGFHCFGTYWLIIVLNNFNDYVCAGCTINAYFNT